MTLHIYGQLWQHDNAFILGTPEDLKQLAEVLSKAADGERSSTNFFPTDGEGYSAIAIALDEESMDGVRLPYSD